MAEPITFTGAAVDQVEAVVRRVAEVTARHPAAAAYSPGEHPLARLSPPSGLPQRPDRHHQREGDQRGTGEQGRTQPGVGGAVPASW